MDLGIPQHRKQHNLFTKTENDFFGEFEFFGNNNLPLVSVKATSPTTIVFVTLKDFQDTISLFKREKEAYCYLGDSVKISSKLEKINIQCISCNSYSHELLSCPYLFY